MTFELRRRSFLGALIGAALAPKLILSSMAEPVRAAVLAPMQALDLRESAIHLPPGLICGIDLIGTSEQSRAGLFRMVRRQGQDVLRFAFNTAGGCLIWRPPHGLDPVCLESAPILIASDADISGHISIRALDSDTYSVARIKDGAVIDIVRA